LLYLLGAAKIGYVDQEPSELKNIIWLIPFLDVAAQPQNGILNKTTLFEVISNRVKIGLFAEQLF
jgi:hypothetical protein